MTQHGYPYQQPGPPPPGYGMPPAGQAGHAPPGGYGVPPAGYGPPAGYPQAGHPQHQQGYPQQGWGPPPAVAPSGQPLADQVTRLLARLIDGLIVGGIATLVFVPVIILVVVASADSIETAEDGTVTSGTGAFVGGVLLAELGLFLFILLIQYVYEVEFAKRTGQTIGKRVMKIRIVPLDPRQQIGRGVLAKRWLVSGLGGLVPGLSLVNVLWCLWDKPYRQCLHDKFASTVVVKVPG